MADQNNMNEELAKQLHEQYAISNNSNVSSFVAMIGALMAAFSGYAYVLYQYLIGDFNCCCHRSNATTMVYIATIAVLLVILVLYIVAIEIGANQRSNQFIVFAIRMDAYSSDEYKKVFPNGYHPFDKTFMGFVQGMYNELSIMFFIIYIIIVLISEWCVEWHMEWWLRAVSIIGFLSMIAVRICKFCKYDKTNSEFKERLKANNNDEKKSHIFDDYFDKIDQQKNKCCLCKFIIKFCNHKHK